MILMAIKSIIRVTQGCQPWVLISWHLTSFPASLFKLAPRLRHCFSMSAKLPMYLCAQWIHPYHEGLWSSRPVKLFGISATQIALHLPQWLCSSHFHRLAEIFGWCNGRKSYCCSVNMGICELGKVKSNSRRMLLTCWPYFNELVTRTL